MDEGATGPRLAGPRRRFADQLVAVEDPAFAELAAAAVERGAPLRWVVIDDLYEDRCELAISPWPRLTAEGRLVFARSEADHVVAVMPAAELWELARAARRRAGEEAAVAGRELRVGDAFAAVLETPDEGGQAPAGGYRGAVRFPWGADGLVDVTAEARVFAKVQLSLAEAPPLGGAELDDLGRGLAG